MENLIERIARHADIDTRRALGAQPRKLVVPDLDLPCASREYVEFNQGVSRRIKFRNAHLYLCPSAISWVFGTDNYMSSRNYSFRRADGLVSFYALRKMEHSRHPDFNEDGSFKRAPNFLLHYLNGDTKHGIYDQYR